TFIRTFILVLFFFSSRRRHTRFSRDWSSDVCSSDLELASIYLIDGFPPMEGDLLKNPNLARTMRILAEQGPDAFYRGEIARQMAAAMEANGGLITTFDLADYRAFEREPVRGSYRARKS